MKEWYKGSTDHEPNPTCVTIRRMMAQRVILYRKVPPPGGKHYSDNIPLPGGWLNNSRSRYGVVHEEDLIKPFQVTIRDARRKYVGMYRVRKQWGDNWRHQLDQGGGPHLDGILGGFDGGGVHLENRRTNTKEEWKLPGDQPSGSSMEDRYGNFEFTSWYSYCFPQCPTWIPQQKRNREQLHWGQCAPKYGGYEVGSPILDIPRYSQGLKLLRQRQVYGNPCKIQRGYTVHPPPMALLGPPHNGDQGLGYCGTLFKGYQGVTQVETLYPIHFSVVAEDIIWHWITVVYTEESGTDSFGRAV